MEATQQQAGHALFRGRHVPRPSRR
jgi:hypothetical protein